jgi:hypothetical protein
MHRARARAPTHMHHARAHTRTHQTLRSLAIASPRPLHALTVRLSSLRGYRLPMFEYGRTRHEESGIRRTSTREHGNTVTGKNILGNTGTKSSGNPEKSPSPLRGSDGPPELAARSDQDAQPARWDCVQPARLDRVGSAPRATCNRQHATLSGRHAARHRRRAAKQHTTRNGWHTAHSARLMARTYIYIYIYIYI